MLGEMTTAEIDQFLTNEVVGRLGCAHDDLIFVVPISYVYDGKDIYAHSTEGTKIDLMRKNKHVCLEVDKMNDMKNWNSVILWGEFEELHESDELAYAYRLIAQRLDAAAVGETAAPPRQTMTEPHDRGRKLIYRIKVTRKTGRFERI